jgi:hypothetical protein
MVSGVDSMDDWVRAELSLQERLLHGNSKNAGSNTNTRLDVLKTKLSSLVEASLPPSSQIRMAQDTLDQGCQSQATPSPYEKRRRMLIDGASIKAAQRHQKDSKDGESHR